MTERHFGSYTPVCDGCGKRLPGEETWREAQRAMLEAGWEVRRNGEEREDICTDCLFEEKGYGAGI